MTWDKWKKMQKKGALEWEDIERITANQSISHNELDVYSEFIWSSFNSDWTYNCI